MVWGAVWVGGRSELVIMDRDPDAPRGGYSAQSYIWALEEGLCPIYRPGAFFLQDNASIHTARITKEWLEAHGIWVWDHPTHSPDLNPIEHVWAAMKRILSRDFPDLWSLGDNKAARAEFDEALREAWRRVPQRLIDNCIKSMPQRLTAVRRARGWYTRY